MPRLRIPKRVRYPVWSVKTITVTALFVVTVTALSVFLLGKRSIFVETELTLGIVAAALFVFLAVGLYHGVRVRRRDVPTFDAPGVDFADLGNNLPGNLGDGVGIPDGLDGDEGCLVAVVGLLLAALAAVVLLVVLWVVLNLGIVLWVFLLTALAYVFYLALRQVFARSRTTRGNLGASLGYALFYTLLYTGWLFAVVFIADALIGRRLREG